MDKIIISNIVAHTIIGVREHEQITPQLLAIDLSFSVDINRAAAHDSLSDTHDYSAITNAVIEFVEKTSCQLLETLAKRLLDFLKKEFQLSWLQLSITKRPVDMPQVAGVTVLLEMRE